MAQKKKKGPAPMEKKPPKARKSTNQILFSIFAVLMAALMVIPLILSFFQ